VKVFAGVKASWGHAHDLHADHAQMARMKRFLTVLSSLLLMTITSTAGLAVIQAGFVAQPYGDQIVNADSSVTLPQGGVLRDNKRGYSIDATYIQYLDNGYMKASNAQIKTSSGQSIYSASVNYDIKADRMIIAGPLQFSDANVTGLKASNAVAYLQAKKTVAFAVSAASPVFRANAVVFDGARNEVFLYGNYEFSSKDGKQKGSGGSATSSAVINFSTPNSPKILSSKAIPAGTLSAYLALIAQSK
jgi:hypothetical protein